VRFEFHLLFLLCIIGVLTRKLSFKGWVGVSALILIWMMWNYMRY
jgi:hypothetical protein